MVRQDRLGCVDKTDQDQSTAAESAEGGPSASVARLSLLQEVIDGQSGEKDQRKEGHDKEFLLAREPPKKEGVEGQKPDQEKAPLRGELRSPQRPDDVPQDESRDRRCESRNDEEAQGPWEGDDVPDLAVDQPAHPDDGDIPRGTPSWVGQKRVSKTEAHEAPLPVRVKEGH